MTSEERYPTGLCVRCHERKSRTVFPVGSARHRGKRRPKRCVVCWACTEAEAYALDVKMSARATWVVDGKRWRRCAECGDEKRLLARNFHVSVKRGTLDENGYRVRRTRYSYYCRPCHNKRTAAHGSKRRESPRGKAMLAANSKRWRERNPEKAAAASARWKARTMADPEKRKAYLETTRISYRLRRERDAGVPLDSIRRPPRTRGPGRASNATVPSAPIVAFLKTRIEQREVVENFLGSKREVTGAKDAVLEALGLDPRQLYRWEHDADRASIALIERVLMLAEAPWSDVYAREDFPDLYADGAPLDLHTEAS